MYTKRGVSLLEILVVSGLVSLVLTAWLWFRVNAASQEQTTALEQEYIEELTKLETRLRQDLRSAVRIETEPTTDPELERTRINLVKPDATGSITMQVVVYELARKSGVVTRQAADRRDTFTFTKFLGGKPFVLRITP